VRNATHAGDWYSDNPKNLEKFISLRQKTQPKPIFKQTRDHVLKGLILPHAGLEYCANVALTGLQHLSPSFVKTVIILGPSHFTNTKECQLSKFNEFATPLGNFQLDSNIQQ
jgi:AmmeMemoRadiSam system protein B